MRCRKNCGACCIAPSISTPMQGLPKGKPAAMLCPHLDDEFHCYLFGLATRPQVCSELQPQPSMCGDNRSEAMIILTKLEMDTLPLRSEK